MKLWTIAGLLGMALMVFGGWYLANARSAIRLPPDQAAMSVARRYAASTTGTFAARHAGSSTNVPGASRIYIVSQDGHDIARVKLKPFWNIGWQEAAYERIELKSPKATK